MFLRRFQKNRLRPFFVMFTIFFRVLENNRMYFHQFSKKTNQFLFKKLFVPDCRRNMAISIQFDSRKSSKEGYTYSWGVGVGVGVICWRCWCCCCWCTYYAPENHTVLLIIIRCWRYGVGSINPRKMRTSCNILLHYTVLQPKIMYIPMKSGLLRIHYCIIRYEL